VTGVQTCALPIYAASNFVKIVEERQGLKIACLEEIAYRNKWISRDDLERLSLGYRDSSFSRYLSEIDTN